MTTQTDRQEFTFQAEIKQLLHLLSHSLYQSPEIAVRELISNASDALDKMRYVSLTDESRRDDTALEIVIEGRENENELVIRDSGIGMTHDELVTNLGTIAHSGSIDFLKAAAARKDEKSDLNLIGQFGVGFYSSFMIAEKVRVRTRSYTEESGWEWESDGTGSFTVTPLDESLPRGTELTLYLKEGSKAFASDWRIKDIVKRYSSFIPYPIRLKAGGEIINDQKPIWVEPKSQVTEEQYTRFYQHLTHHTDEKPLWHLHMAADSPIQFRAIVYCPATNLESLGFARLDHGLSLCAKRVLVQSDCRELVPEYLRFLRGLVDSEDLPLNVSRETLQDNTVIRKMRTSIVKGVLDRLDRLAQDERSPSCFDLPRRGVMTRNRWFHSTPTSRRCPKTRSRSIIRRAPTSLRSRKAPISRSSVVGGSRSFTSPTRSTSSRSDRSMRIARKSSRRSILPMSRFPKRPRPARKRRPARRRRAGSPKFSISSAKRSGRASAKCANRSA
jgi:molecular chaperone HtpG